MKKDKQIVARINYACPVCAKVDEDQMAIAISECLQDISKMDNKTVGFADQPCKECKKLMEMGIVVIVADVAKTVDIDNPYRTGHLFVITEDYLNKLVSDPDKLKEILNKRVMLMDIKVAEALNFPLKSEENGKG